ncbi:Adaptive-response sensory-kinase SasA [Paenibacillus solanacearum]|uniref:histidine kinase n=1 Tax=Paenibacillus solanacearum TaxID=2048548 RepID=A0A916NS97_9BACL|nr:HAMP domain-containing sensor histidine kinase [Paenibacillus solanacearum]CAG7652827.1 Adaptive-response sensory-kinase SasA [Paenibacillus solanacearum]
MIRRPRSLRFQLLSRSLLILSVLLLMIGVFQYVIMAQFLYKNKASTIQSQIRTVPFPFWQQAANNPEKIDFRNPVSSLRAGGSTVAFLDADNRLQVLIQDPDETAAAPRLTDQDYKEALHPQTAPDYRIVKDERGTKHLVVLRPITARDRLIGIVQVSSKLEPLQSIVVGQLLTYVGLSVLALAAGLLTFLPILRRTLIPLSRMTETVEKINAGNLDERLPIRHEQEEIDRLSLSFNAMLERLEHSFAAEKQAKEQMRRFIADASHELRTPLTSIHGFLEVLLRGAASDPDQLRNALRSMYGESKRLNGLAEELLMLARLDQAPVMQQAEGKLSELLREMEHQLRLFAGERNVEIRIATEQTSRFDRNRMKQVVLNLFQNAVQHTDPNAGHVSVSLERQREAMVFTVEDNGAGFAEEHAVRLFDRFYRVDTARSRKQGGAGLGLSITKSIVELHGGTIAADGRPGKGARFTVRLPLA